MINNPNGGPKDIKEFIEEYTKICEQGFIKSHRKSDTGIGKTLEDLLGITENDIQGPDFADYELKARRINKDNSMVSLFIKAPDEKGANNKLRKEYGYKRNPDDKYNILHLTLEMGTSVGDKKLGLKIVDDKLFITSFDSPIPYAYYQIDGIMKSLNSKYVTGKAVFAEAESRGPKSSEEFHYEAAQLATGLNVSHFLSMLEEGLINS